MASKGRIITSLVLRIFTILFAAGCIVFLILDKANNDDNGSKVTFNNFIAYRYVLITAIIAAAYCVFQLPFTLYRACTGKKLIRGTFLPAFYFYGDQVVAFILATGVGAGFLVTAQLMDIPIEISPIEISPFEGFFNKQYLSTGLLTGAFLCMAFLLIFLTPPRTVTDKKAVGNKGFFFR